MKNDVDGMAPVADKLVADVKRLHDRDPGAPSSSPRRSPTERSTCSTRSRRSKITGEEDRYSHTDLWDFEANVDGCAGRVRRGEADRRGARPRARGEDPDRLRRRARARSTRTRQGDGYVTYDQLTKADTRRSPRRSTRSPTSSRRSRRSSWSRAERGAAAASLRRAVPRRRRAASRPPLPARPAVAELGAVARGPRRADVRRRGRRSTASTRPGSSPPVQERCSSARSTCSDRRPRGAAARCSATWTDRGRAAHRPASRSVRSNRSNDEAAPGDTGEAVGLPPARAHDHGRARSERVRRPDGRDRMGLADRLARAARRDAERSAATCSTRTSPTATSRCSAAPTIPRSRSTRSTTSRASPGARRIGALDAARLRSDVDDHAAGGETPAQPAWVQGRHEQHQRPTTTRRCATTCGSASATDPEWMVGGSYVVMRRIRMLLEAGTARRSREQERVIGRHEGRRCAARSAQRARRSRPRRQGLRRPTPDRRRRAHPRSPRRSRTTASGSCGAATASATASTSAPASSTPGLFFIAYQRDPRRQFIPLQKRLAGSDALNEYIKHVGSAALRDPPRRRDRATTSARRSSSPERPSVWSCPPPAGCLRVT